MPFDYIVAAQTHASPGNGWEWLLWQDKCHRQSSMWPRLMRGPDGQEWRKHWLCRPECWMVCVWKWKYLSVGWHNMNLDLDPEASECGCGSTQILDAHSCQTAMQKIFCQSSVQMWKHTEERLQKCLSLNFVVLLYLFYLKCHYKCKISKRIVIIRDELLQDFSTDTNNHWRVISANINLKINIYSFWM